MIWLRIECSMRDRMAVRENPKGNKEIQESREMSEVVFMLPNTFSH